MDIGIKRSTKEKFRVRSPLDLVDVLKFIVKDRVFCDLGCGAGDLVKAISPYCKRAFGVELNDGRRARALEQGVEVIDGHLLTMQLPEADVYYIWVNDSIKVVERIKKGIIIQATEDLKDLSYNLIVPFVEPCGAGNFPLNIFER